MKKNSAFKMYVDENDNITTAGISTGHFLAPLIKKFLKDKRGKKWTRLEDNPGATIPEPM
ncbi:MAG: hypothetical protein KF845_05880 [Cyclobacteriaceae bacterium]|nr:hypothetical protein [Cyclobacteriaceae bacterium]